MTVNKSANKLSLIAATFILAGSTVLGQAQGMQPNAPPPQPPAPGMAGPNGTMPAAADSGTQASYADQMFLKHTLQDDQAQVQMSQLVVQKSSSDDVKQFGQNMIKLHNDLDNQLMPLVKQFAISETQKPSKKEKEALAKLETLSGSDFDTAYLQAMAVAQEQTIKEFKGEATAAQNLELQNLARTDEQTLSLNFGVLQKLAQAHNVQLASK